MATETGTPVTRLDKTTRPGTDRLPVAPRQRRPALAALAVLLILGGGLISAVLVLRSGQKEPVIMLQRDVAVGKVITRGDLTQVQVGGLPKQSRVPWAQIGEVVGRRANTDLKKGTILNGRDAVEKQIPALGEIGVGVGIKPGNLPANGLQVGDSVKVVSVPTSNTTQNSTGAQYRAPTGPVLVQQAFVSEIGPPRTDGTVTVTLVVKETESVLLAQQNALQAIALLELPKAS